MTDWNLVSNKDPTRQGFYLVKTQTRPTAFVAEWREYDKKQGKQWWIHTSENPTEPKTPKLLEAVVCWAKATQAQVTEALKREPTTEEKIEAAYQSYRRIASLYPTHPARPPERRRLKIGDRVEYGALDNVVVVALKEDERVVVMSHHTRERHYGKLLELGVRYTAAHWTDVRRELVEQPKRVVRKSLLEDAYSSRVLDGFMGEVLNGLDASPDYQRGYVWTEEDQQRYLDSLVYGRDLGRFIIVKREYPFARQVLDGKQRINCLELFFRSEIPWRGRYFDEMNKADASDLRSRTIQVAYLREGSYTRADLLRIFLEVNQGGVPQSPVHLRHVEELLKQEEAKTASGNA